MNTRGNSALSGALSLTPILKPKPVKIVHVLKRGMPNRQLNPAVNTWRKGNMLSILEAAAKLWVAEKLGVQHFYGALYLEIVRPVIDVSELQKRYADLMPPMNFVEWASLQGVMFLRQPLGLAGLKVVTTAGLGYIVDAFQNSTELENMKYHALGTGSTAENASDTALVTELTTEYTGNVRATGTTTEGASANIYRSVATNTLDGTPGAALREHGLMSQAATGGGVLLDRTLYDAITLSSGEGLQSTYDLTTSGS